MINTRYIDLSESTENSNALVCPVVLITTDAFENLRIVDLYLRALSIGQILLADQFGTDISLSLQSHPPDPTTTGRFSIQKQAPFPLYFTENVWMEYLENCPVMLPVYGLLFTKRGFRSAWTNFLGEDEISSGDISQQLDQRQADEDVPKFVKALNSEAIHYLPSSSVFWLTNEQPDPPIWWKKISVAKLMCTFCKELRLTGSTAELIFLSDRRITVPIPLRADNLADSYTQVQAIGRWLYQDTKGTDTRHALLNNQVGMLPIADVEIMPTNLRLVAEKILAGAEMAYRYYLQDSNKELYKSLTEINKTLFEYTSKIRQNIMDLINGLWRDFTTAFGLLVLDFSQKKPDVPGFYWNWLLYGLTVYLVVNLALTANMGFWFYYKVKASLTEMRSRIYGYLTDNDYNIYAFDPLKTAFRKFRATFFWIVLCYLAIIALVVLSIFFSPKVAIPVLKSQLR